MYVKLNETCFEENIYTLILYALYKLIFFFSLRDQFKLFQKLLIRSFALETSNYGSMNFSNPNHNDDKSTLNIYDKLIHCLVQNLSFIYKN